ncbi:hypothetical protein [Terrilactibacillus tamarindi]|uniref:hypothetical protein n=1 Tax=Terrilactibacillus tamarindi TaxID=2599694 RepID=UPI001E3EE469|nr:hypothetical protein [Terrilactibacillus tamarindi]
MAKLTGVSPLHGSHAAASIACDAFNARTRLCGSIIIPIKKSWQQSCLGLFVGSLTGVARYFTRSWRVSPLAFSLSERIRLLYTTPD